MLTQLEADHERLAPTAEEGHFNRGARFRNDNPLAQVRVLAGPL